MRLDYRRPSPRWSSSLSIFGHIHSLAAPATESIPALLPNLHVMLSGRALYRFADGRVRAAPPVAVVGATLSMFAMDLSADYEMICIGFLPRGWTEMVGLPASRLADDVADAAELWPQRDVASLWHAVADARGFAKRQEIVEAFLHAQAVERGGRDVARGVLVQRWLEEHDTLALDGLADRLDLSWRQVERLTLGLYGASPKTLAMKYRALRIAGALAVQGEAALERALDVYADQSHLIRDFRRFVGVTPRRFLRERHALARATMQGRWDAGVRAPLALLS